MKINKMKIAGLFSIMSFFLATGGAFADEPSAKGTGQKSSCTSGNCPDPMQSERVEKKPLNQSNTSPNGSSNPETSTTGSAE